MRRILLSLIGLVLSAFLIFGCAGTKKGDDYSDSSADQDQELQDIEALLGITTEEEDEPAQRQAPKEDSDEKLKLLDQDEVLNKEQGAGSSSLAAAAMADDMSSEQKKKYEDQIDKLEREVRQKDLEIADLKAQIQLQQEEFGTRGTTSSASGFSGVVSSVSTEEYQERYDEARSAFENRNYELAIQLFQSLLSASTTHSLADNAQFWIGESHYALKQYDTAIIDFEKVFTFPKSNKNADAQFKLGVCYLRKGDRAKAAEELERLLNDYPNSELVERANTILGKISG